MEGEDGQAQNGRRHAETPPPIVFESAELVINTRCNPCAKDCYIGSVEMHKVFWKLMLVERHSLRYLHGYASGFDSNCAFLQLTISFHVTVGDDSVARLR